MHLLKACSCKQCLPALDAAPEAKVTLIFGGPRPRRQAPQQRWQHSRALIDTQETSRCQHLGGLSQRVCDAGGSVQGIAGQEQVVVRAQLLRRRALQVP